MAYPPELAEAKALIDSAADTMAAQEARIEALETERRAHLAEIALLRPVAEALQAFTDWRGGSEAVESALRAWQQWRAVSVPEDDCAEGEG